MSIEPAPRRIAVFRALVLGDLLCALPALRAVRHAWPDAELTLVGLPWARHLVARLGWIDRFIEFPGFPGLPERTFDRQALPGFLRDMQSQGVDLLLQMHGSGNIVNPLMAACGATRIAGFVEPDGWCRDPALHALWPTRGHEIDRLLALTDHLGLPPQGRQLEFPIRDADRAEAAALWPGYGSGVPFACIHAGAQLPSRRWPVDRFAAVARHLHRAGLAVVLTGTADERDLVAALAAAAEVPVVNLCGRTDLWSLGALIERAALLVCNDTGVSHVASALGTRSVVVSSGGDVARWAPLDTRRHRVLWHDVPCRPCGYRVCPTGHECARGVSVDDVLEACRS